MKLPELTQGCMICREEKPPVVFGTNHAGTALYLCGGCYTRENVQKLVDGLKVKLN